MSDIVDSIMIQKNQENLVKQIKKLIKENTNNLSKYVGRVKKDKGMTDSYTHTSPNYIVEIANRADEIIVPLIQVG